MRNGFRISGLVLLAVVFATPLMAQRDADPESIFRRCKNTINERTERCVRSMNATTEECVVTIRRLLHEGNRERAIAVARRCIHSLETTSVSCQRTNRSICQVCIRRLIQLEAEELARRLHSICERSVDTIRRAEARNKNRIRELF